MESLTPETETISNTKRIKYYHNILWGQWDTSVDKSVNAKSDDLSLMPETHSRKERTGQEVVHAFKPSTAEAEAGESL